MGLRSGAGHRLAAMQPPASIVPKSITFHDFCDLTQRDLAELSLRNGIGAKQQQQAIWQQREECIREDDEQEGEEEEEEGGREQQMLAGPVEDGDGRRSPVRGKGKCADGPRWHSMSVDDRDPVELEFRQSKQQQLNGDGGNAKKGKRKRPLNATFSSWIQLFLAKRRHRHNRYVDPHGLGMMHQSCYDGIAGSNGGPLRSSVSLSVVHEGAALGSDGESIEVSPCTSDQSGMESGVGGGGGTLLTCSTGTMESENAEGSSSEYIPKVKMRHKQNRRWTEEDIQKRLSLPPDIKLPQNVIDKLNRTPTLENPLTRKSKRASLSEIGFGKLETYKKIFDLGEGTYATVYLGKSLLTGKNVALKEIRLEHEEGAPCTAIREVSLLRNLKHANIVTLHDIVYTDRVLTLVFEFVERDLREYMEELEGMISIANVKLFLAQLLRGLAYCHARRILHRDLKPQNLLINRAGELKLADFGLARAKSVPTKTYSNEVVTLWYRPPDVLLGSIDYSTHIDMWGVGCILYEMLLHKPMFPGSTTDEQLNLIFQRLGTPTPETHPDLCALPNFKNAQFRSHSAKQLACPPRITAERADLLNKLLQYEGKHRISALEAMRHPFLQCFPEQLFKLADTESVLNLPGVYYVRDSRNELHSRNIGRHS